MTYETPFGQMIAENPLDESQEETLARMMALVLCANDRTPTADERLFAEGFAPRVDTPLENLAEDDLKDDEFEDVDEEIAPTLLMITYAAVFTDRPQDSQKHAMAQRIRAMLPLSATAAGLAEASAEDHVRLQRQSAPVTTESAAATEARHDAFVAGKIDDMMARHDPTLQSRGPDVFGSN